MENENNGARYKNKKWASKNGTHVVKSNISYEKPYAIYKKKKGSIEMRPVFK